MGRRPTGSATLIELAGLIDDSAGPAACWPWLGGRDKDGYGRHGSASRRIPRMVCEATYGPPFPRAVALHSCDNPPCCNPSHLRWGTQKENVADAMAKGRHRPGPRRVGSMWHCRGCGEPRPGHYITTCPVTKYLLDSRCTSG